METKKKRPGNKYTIRKCFSKYVWFTDTASLTSGIFLNSDSRDSSESSGMAFTLFWLKESNE